MLLLFIGFCIIHVFLTFLFQNKMALNGCNGCFISVDDDGDIVCQSKSAGPKEMIKVQ